MYAKQVPELQGPEGSSGPEESSGPEKLSHRTLISHRNTSYCENLVQGNLLLVKIFISDIKVNV